MKSEHVAILENNGQIEGVWFYTDIDDVTDIFISYKSSNPHNRVYAPEIGINKPIKGVCVHCRKPVFNKSQMFTICDECLEEAKKA